MDKATLVAKMVGEMTELSEDMSMIPKEALRHHRIHIEGITIRVVVSPEKLVYMHIEYEEDKHKITQQPIRMGTFGDLFRSAMND